MAGCARTLEPGAAGGGRSGLERRTGGSAVPGAAAAGAGAGAGAPAPLDAVFGGAAGASAAPPVSVGDPLGASASATAAGSSRVGDRSPPLLAGWGSVVGSPQSGRVSASTLADGRRGAGRFGASTVGVSSAQSFPCSTS
jgi:hypothetical protein